MFKASSRKLWWLFLVAGLSLAMAGLMSCGGNSTTSTQPTTGTINAYLSDPPSCLAEFSNVWVTVTKVTANISSTAGPNDSGWQTLVDLTKSPKQLDLLSLASTTCVLTQLGSSQGLPPGQYQQIRFYLLDNAASGVTITTTASGGANPCGKDNSTGPFNCVVPQGGSAQTLLLSSEAQTGIKIPSGQIAGGQFTIAAGQATDLNIDFSTCQSLVAQGNGQWRLKPVLHAGEVALNNNALSGKVVDASNSNAPVPGAIVLLEQPDANGIDRVYTSKTTGTDGSFIFCPLPAGATFDIAVDAQTTSSALPPVTTTYIVTVAFKVPVGTAVGNIPLTPESTAVTGSAPASITGPLTTAGAAEDVAVAPLLQLTPMGGSSVQVTIPVFGSPLPPQPPTFTTAAGASCPAGTDCTDYTVQVPAGVPTVGTFSSGAITFGASTNPVSYSINGHTDKCTGDGTVTGLTVTAGSTTPAATAVALTGCS